MGILVDVLQSLGHWDEISCMVQLKREQSKIPKRPKANNLTEFTQLDCRSFGYAALDRVSRSFAFVIQILPERVRDAICVFYLVLRALDTIEDDMEVDPVLKEDLLTHFHEKLSLKSYSVSGIGKGDERTLLENFSRTLEFYHTLDEQCKEVIRDITEQMGNGMQEFAEKKTVATLAEWDQYCFYVAGLVGYGLSALFSATKLEVETLKDEKPLSKSMGLFLQKTNIIRDYLEDLEEGRIFWPDEVWTKYAPTLGWFKYNPDELNSRRCLNHLISNAMDHGMDCVSYMSKIRNPGVFRFCGIPQVMAMATLAECYNNSGVFRRNVKIRKGLTARIMVECVDLNSFKSLFAEFARTIVGKMSVVEREDDPELVQKLSTIIAASGKLQDGEKRPSSQRFFAEAMTVFFVATFLYALTSFVMRK
eukprot:TRINITY_DN12553_c0_g1_i1.p1 TRINITY_DN12553_c0_g1~~TRINITY_DN12553_c0_g1_i1.p1  ORF type:complete len:421 (-),score=119.36 TRINITY_DN12553_c0_g1_i1:129-1391(-)